MNDKKVMHVALAVSLIGLAATYITTLFVGPAPAEIGQLDEDDAGRHVQVNGTILSASTSGGNVFLRISDKTGNITAVIFEKTARGVDWLIIRGDHVTVTGQVNIYKGELEIIVENIWKL